MTPQINIALKVNGRKFERVVEPRLLLADFLREELHLTGTHVGCEHGICGACTILLDGSTARACLTFAVQCDGSEIVTVEGLSEGGELSSLQSAFRKHHALQCGFCTSGMLLTATEMVTRCVPPVDQEIREALSGNLCRCTGYQSIVDAMMDVLSTGERP